MAATISNAALVLSCNASGLYSGMSQAGGRIKSWATQQSRTVDGIKPGGGGIVAGIAGRFGGMVPALAGIAAGALSAAKAMETLHDTANMGDIADAFGSSAEGVSGLLGALGSLGAKTSENIEGLSQFKQKVMDAANGVGEEPKKLFEGLSVTAKELVKLPLEEQFLKMHEAIRKLPQDQQMFKLSMLGGTDSMKQWIKILGMSSQQLRERSAALAVSNADMKSAQSADKAMIEAEMSMSRAWQNIVVALAPFIDAIASVIPAAISALSVPFRGMGEMAMPVIHGIATGVGYILDAFRGGMAVVKIFAGSMTEAFGLVVEALGKVVGLAKDLPDDIRPKWVDNLADSIKAFGNREQMLGRAAREDGQRALAEYGVWGKRIDQWFADWQANRNRRMGNVLGGAGGDDKGDAAKSIKLGGAAVKGSKEDYSILANFEASGMLQNDIQKRQLAVQQLAVQAIGKVEAAVKATGLSGILGIV